MRASLSGNRGRSDSLNLTGEESWSLYRLLLASFLTLFAELAFIRWLAVEVRVFAYFKNLALLVCFLGFGLGCALARQRVHWILSGVGVAGLLTAIRFPSPSRGAFLEQLSTMLGAASDVQIWQAGHSWDAGSFLLAAAISCALLLLLLCVFIPLGQVVSRQIDLASRTLYGYSWNLAGSLAGILGFFLVCWLMLPPGAWMAIILGGFVLLQKKLIPAMLFAAIILPALLVLREPNTTDRTAFWTPYQQIEIQRQRFADGEFKKAAIMVNHTGYQWMVNLSPDFLRRHPKLLNEPPDENPYNLPFRFTTSSPRVLIVGAGAGNDAAAALRNGSQSVDAVEIDPAIWQLGLREHPEHPYQSPKVTGYLTDARAFLKRTDRTYDLILFGLLDSHTQFSDYSNMRIDNFVYTEESFREARQLLTPEGVLFVKFQVERPWMRQRLVKLLTLTFGKTPLVFVAGSNYSASATCFVISSSDRVEKALAADPRLATLVKSNVQPVVDAVDIVPTTDDWPYLYQEGRWIPRTFLSISLLVVLLSVVLYGRIPKARRLPSLFFFSMGAGFLLLETQTISRLALYFGTTWQVNGIVIAALLTALLLANAVAESHRGPFSRVRLIAGLVGGVALAYLLPFHLIPGPAAFAGLVAAAIFSVPVFFAGLLFAAEFRKTQSPSAALGANMLGAVAGGLLENLSFVIGMRALLLVAMGLYCLAAVGLWRERLAPVETPEELLPEHSPVAG